MRYRWKGPGCLLTKIPGRRFLFIDEEFDELGVPSAEQLVKSGKATRLGMPAELTAGNDPAEVKALPMVKKAEPKLKAVAKVGVMDVEITPGPDGELGTEDDKVKITKSSPTPKKTRRKKKKVSDTDA